MDKHLHIVCFDVPYPADYGGVIDVFSRIKALQEAGVKIHLHCFEYGRGKPPDLNKFCTEITYYKRNTGWKGFSINLPYIVYSRVNKNLLQNLLKDDHPILLEGIHCTYFLFTGDLKNKKVFVRLHNVEAEYYQTLARNELSFFKKLYFRNESRLLKRYEGKIAGKATLLAINKKDIKTFQDHYQHCNIKYLPSFSLSTSLSVKQGKGSYCLYHGNLSITENENAVIWLIEKVFHKLEIPFVVAGKKPSKNLENIVKETDAVSLISSPSEEKMTELIANAQINVLPSYNSTGTKLKLLNALFNGRHCLVNNSTVEGTGLETLCHSADNEKEFRELVVRLFDKPLEAGETDKRIELLKEYDNDKNARLLMQMIY